MAINRFICHLNIRKMDNYIEYDTFQEDERRINESKVRNIFTPFTPISNLALFQGRKIEMHKGLSALNTPGQHLLLFGDRGVGKSSLANIISNQLVKITGRKLIKKSCSSSDSFETIVEGVLNEAGIDTMKISSKTKQGVGLKGLSYESETSQSGYDEKIKSPSWVANRIKDEDVLFLIDEFDSIKIEGDKKKIAELIKLLSDFNSTIKIFIVGIAESSIELTEGHPSVQRCLKEIKLNKMTINELSQILDRGEAILQIEFTKMAKRRICRLSSGYPHFTHLIALKAAENAIIDEIKVIDIPDVNRAVRESVEDGENVLANSYRESMRSFSSKTLEKCKQILYAISLCRDEFICNDQIRVKYKTVFKEELPMVTLNNYLSKMVSDKEDKLLRRLSKGVYRFNDPRMISYIKLVNNALFSDFDNEEIL